MSLPKLAILATLAFIVATPFAAAGNDTKIDVNYNDNTPDESTPGFGMSTTVVIVLVVLAVLVVALIVAMANRP